MVLMPCSCSCGCPYVIPVLGADQGFAPEKNVTQIAIDLTFPDLDDAYAFYNRRPCRRCTMQYDAGGNPTGLGYDPPAYDVSVAAGIYLKRPASGVYVLTSAGSFTPGAFGYRSPSLTITGGVRSELMNYDPPVNNPCFGSEAWGFAFGFNNPVTIQRSRGVPYFNNPAISPITLAELQAAANAVNQSNQETISAQSECKACQVEPKSDGHRVRVFASHSSGTGVHACSKLFLPPGTVVTKNVIESVEGGQAFAPGGFTLPEYPGPVSLEVTTFCGADDVVTKLNELQSAINNNFFGYETSAFGNCNFFLSTRSDGTTRYYQDADACGPLPADDIIYSSGTSGDFTDITDTFTINSITVYFDDSSTVELLGA